MNQFVPDWSNMADTSRPLGEDDDLVELLWCNGHVVMQSQTHRKLPPRPEKPIAAAAPAAVQDDEAGLWFPFSLADSLDKDIFSELFYEPPSTPAAPPEPAAAGADGGKPSRNDPRAVDEKRGGFSALMPPPKSTTHAPCSRLQTMSLAGGAADLSDLVQPRARSVAAADAGAASMLSAVEASVCGSNLQRTVSGPGSAGALPDTAHGGGGSALPSAMGSANANAICRGREATVASSSGRSNGCFGTTTEPTSTSNRSSRRKRMDTEDSESPSEDAESESALLERKPPQKVTTARRSRAAEVHNLSERRRRDRINEKMKTLQDLIPHCNKTDKASMLDEAIEYLKSLQMQVQAGQMMWMGSGMAPPVMFPGVHHQYLQQMGVGMGAAAMPPSMQRMPFMAAAQQVVPSAPAVSPMSLCAPQGHASPAYGGHMPGVGMPAHYLGVNHLQPPPSQGVGYYPLEAKIEQLHVPIGTTPAATATPARILLPPENAQSRR